MVFFLARMNLFASAKVNIYLKSVQLDHRIRANKRFMCSSISLFLQRINTIDKRQPSYFVSIMID